MLSKSDAKIPLARGKSGRYSGRNIAQYSAISLYSAIKMPHIALYADPYSYGPCQSTQVPKLCDGEVISLNSELGVSRAAADAQPDGVDGAVSEMHGRMTESFGSNVCYGRVRDWF